MPLNWKLGEHFPTVHLLINMFSTLMRFFLHAFFHNQFIFRLKIPPTPPPTISLLHHFALNDDATECENYLWIFFLFFLVASSLSHETVATTLLWKWFINNNWIAHRKFKFKKKIKRSKLYAFKWLSIIISTTFIYVHFQFR